MRKINDEFRSRSQNGFLPEARNGSWPGTRSGFLAGQQWRYPGADTDTGSRAVKCTTRITLLKNVRRDTDMPDCWRAAGHPATLRSDNWRPCFRLALPDTGGTAIVWRNGALLGFSMCDNEDADDAALQGAVSETGSLDGEIIDAAVVEAGIIRLMLKHSTPQYVTYDSNGNFTLQGKMPALPPVSFITETATPLTVRLDDLQLRSAMDSRSPRPSSADSTTLSDMMLDAYKALEQKALNNHLFLQPTLLRATYCDANGDAIASGPPVLAGTFTGGSPAVFDVDSSFSLLSGASLSAVPYKVTMKVADTLPEPWCRIVARLKVECVGVLCPVNFSSQASVAMVQSGSEWKAEATLPGIAIGSSQESLQARRRMILDALVHSENLYSTLTTVEAPLRTLQSRRLPGTSVRANTSRLGITKARHPLRDEVSYSAILRQPDLLVAANPRTELFRGFRFRDFAVGEATSSTAWYSFAITTVGEGDAALHKIAADYDSCPSPTLLSALITYPDPSATELNLRINYGNGTQKQVTLPLTPIPELGMAYFLTPDAASFEPTDSIADMAPPAAGSSAFVAPGELRVFPPALPGSPIDIRQCCHGTVHSIATAPRSAGAWDFSRRKIVIGSNDGIHLLTLDGKNLIHSFATLDRRPVTCALASGIGSKGSSLLASGGGALLEIEQRGVSTLRRMCPATDVGCSAAGEVWVRMADGRFLRYTPEGDEIEVELPGINAGCRLVKWGNRLLISGGGKLLDTSEEQFADSVTAEIRHSHSITERTLRVGAVVFDLEATETEGELGISGNSCTDHPVELVRLTCSGNICGPLKLRTGFPQRRHLLSTVRLLANENFIFRNVQLFSGL